MSVRRVMRLVGVFAFVGVLLTLVTAWAPPLLFSMTSVAITYTPPPPGAWLSSASRVPEGFVKGTHVIYRGVGMRYELVTEMVWIGSRLGMMTDRQNRSIERVEVGWPWSAMEWVGEMDVRHEDARWAWNQGVRVPGRDGQLALGAERRLPLVVLWPGFVLDVLVLGAMAWGATGGVGAARRWGRRRGGRCEGCGYRLTGNVTGTCPECGRRLPSSGGGRIMPHSGRQGNATDCVDGSTGT